ncbi:hypothetical protein QY95_03009 [Bacillus thermotolerans]|uniref:Uncharacterized protein n=1 Tax=Bacillus thermotolerans TaxID=1221996 RepID=A0A0F5HTX0_BACTR|nr:hypothetical protein QY95_03009 [Bacillus thermotolerans]
MIAEDSIRPFLKKGGSQLVSILFTVLLVLAFLVSVTMLIQRRKKAGITGLKTALTSICFYLIAAINLLAYWFGFLGLVSWSMTVMLLLLGAYFTKYMAVSER